MNRNTGILQYETPDPFHETQGYEDGYQAFTTTMDYFNNSVGNALGTSWQALPDELKPDIATATVLAVNLYQTGSLYVWWPAGDFTNTDGTLRFSDGKRITNN